MRKNRAIAIGAIVQAIATALYVATVPELGQHVVLLGFVGGTCAAVLADLPRGVWVEGAAGAVAGGCLFLLGFLAWGGYQAAIVGGRLGGRMFGVYISTVVTHAVMLLVPFAIEGLIAGALVGWIQRSTPVEAGRKLLRNVTRR